MNWRKLSFYYKKCLEVLPEKTSSQDTSKLVILFFGIGGLDILKEVDALNKQQLIDFIYAHQILPPYKTNDTSICGFRGSLCIGSYANPEEARKQSLSYDSSHVTMVYSALCSLLILGDDFSKLDRKSILEGIAALQNANGGFQASKHCPELDLRFVLSAIASCYMLDDFSYINVKSVVQYISNCKTYEGGFSQVPHAETHGGSTLCAVASLKLLGKLDDVLSSKDKEVLIRWCLRKQDQGFHGRPNKDDDSCYTFWIGATLKILDGDRFIDKQSLFNFVKSTQSPITGGCSKYPADSDTSCPDPLHSYLAVAGLATISDWPEGLIDRKLEPVVPELNLTERAVLHMRSIHSVWKQAAPSGDVGNGVNSMSRLGCL